MLATPPLPLNDAALNALIANPERLAVLHDTQLLDTPAEQVFDRMTLLAAQATGAPVTAITLVDGDRDFYKSDAGFIEPLASTRVLSGRTLCQHAMSGDQPLVLDDVQAHAAYGQVPGAALLGIRAYAGVPLITESGHRLGTFCALDFQPRHWRTLDVQILTELARATLREVSLRQALRRAAEANRAKSVFLSNMSHEIRTPMNAIIGLTHLMANDATDALLRERLSKVDTAAQHLLQVINDILDLSKIEAGKMRLENTNFSVDTLVDSCCRLVGAAAQDKGLELVIDTDHMPAWLRGDPTRLRQALLNLLSNAVKFTDQGWVRLSCERLREVDDRVEVRFEVRDSGIGIAPEALPSLFNAYEQADDTITRRHGGTGLGLALTRHLAHLMGGEVGVDSAPGQGSRFWFTAWLGRATNTAEHPHAAPASPLQGLRARVVDEPTEALAVLRQAHAGQRVLLAEDNLINQEVARELLQNAGLTVDLAEHGQQAIALANAKPYDLILMDMQMPVMDGLAATREIRTRLGSALPIIAMTANAFSEDRDACLQAGMDDHVAKPVDPQRLYQTLLRWLPHKV